LILEFFFVVINLKTGIIDKEVQSIPFFIGSGRGFEPSDKKSEQAIIAHQETP